MKKLLERYWGILFIVIAWGIFSSPFFVKGLLPFPTRYLVTTFAPWSTQYGMPVKSGSMPDVITQIYPWKNITIESWKRGKAPLWNPYSFSGTVHAANYQTAVFSPINLLYFIFSQPIAWSVSVLLQPLLAGLFMYLYLTSEKISKEGRVIGSLAFIFCGFLVTWMAYQTLAFAALFLPLCFYAVNKVINDKKWWAFPLMSLAVWFSLVSGHFQTSIYVLIATIFYLLYRGIVMRKYARASYLAVFVALGVLLASPQLFITYDAYIQSVRSTTFSKGEIIPWSYFITFFAPDFYGNPVTRNDWFGHYAEWAGFIGVVPLLFSCIALTARKSSKWFFIGLFLFSLLLSTPTLLTDLMYRAHIPVLSTSSASRIILLVSFALSVLSAYGTDALSLLWEEKKKRIVVFFVLSLGIFLASFWIILFFFHPLPADKLSIAVRNSILPSIILVISSTIFLIGRVVDKRKRVWLIWILLCITMFDVVRFASKWMPFEEKEFLYPSMAITKKLDEMLKNSSSRVVGNYGNELGGMYHVPSLEGYDAMYKRRYGEFVSFLSNGKMNIPSRSVVTLDKHGSYTQDGLELLGVRFYLHKFSDGRFAWAYPFWEYSQYQSIWKDDAYELFENKKAYPRAFLASNYKIVSDTLETLETMFADTMNRNETIILDATPSIEPREGPSETNIISYMPEEIVVKTKSDIAKLLFLSDTFDTGWKATVDGKSTLIYRADYTFRAVSVPSGEHTIIFRYHPESFRWGIIVSFVSFIVIALGSIVFNKYENRFL